MKMFVTLHAGMHENRVYVCICAAKGAGVYAHASHMLQNTAYMHVPGKKLVYAYEIPVQNSADRRARALRGLLETCMKQADAQGSNQTHTVSHTKYFKMKTSCY